MLQTRLTLVNLGGSAAVGVDEFSVSATNGHGRWMSIADAIDGPLLPGQGLIHWSQ